MAKVARNPVRDLRMAAPGLSDGWADFINCMTPPEAVGSVKPEIVAAAEL